MRIELNQIVQLKKKHPCGGDRWKIVRVGADIKITCLVCSRTVMLDRAEFIKRIKRIEPQCQE
jgi:hypothetical protein